MSSIVEMKTTLYPKAKPQFLQTEKRRRSRKVRHTLEKWSLFFGKLKVKKVKNRVFFINTLGIYIKVKSTKCYKNYTFFSL